MRIGDGISVREFVARRDRVLKALNGAIGVVFAGDGPPALSGFWEPDWNFYYLTGIRDEPGAAVLFDPRAEDPLRRCVLFLKPLNPEIEAWDGYRDRISTALKQESGFDSVMRTYALPRTLTTIARRRGTLACLHPFAVYDAPITLDLAVFRKVAERCIGVAIKDFTNLLPSMRAVKSAREVREVERAAGATAAGYAAAARMIRPGVAERDVQRAVEDGFRAGGASGTGYNSIVGAGLNSTVLHYMANNATAQAGEVILIDAGARVGGYTADVTRTLPVSGKFTAEQREVYEVVLAALEAGIRAVRPGVHMSAVDAAARKVIDRAGFGDQFIHGIGHQLGIEVHDSTPDGPLKAGMIVTIEPGIYIPEKRLGIRIEDDILVTPRGSRNLTAAIPKTVRAVEAMMRSAQR
ncbi:MAG: aminopeptidase P N-terminal domain-containing protein [Phycisphaerales bacterium]